MISINTDNQGLRSVKAFKQVKASVTSNNRLGMNTLEQWFLIFFKSENTFDYIKICWTPKLMIQKTNENIPRGNKYIIKYI